MSSSEDEFPALKHAVIKDTKSQVIAQAEADVKAFVDNSVINEEASSDDLESTYNFTQKEKDKSIDIRNAERLYKLASGSKTSDRIRATAYIKAAVDAVDKRKRRTKKLEAKKIKKMKDSKKVKKAANTLIHLGIKPKSVANDPIQNIPKQSDFEPTSVQVFATPSPSNVT